jgi:hypothetical protein
VVIRMIHGRVIHRKRRLWIRGNSRKTITGRILLLLVLLMRREGFNGRRSQCRRSSRAQTLRNRIGNDAIRSLLLLLLLLLWGETTLSGRAGNITDLIVRLR